MTQHERHSTELKRASSIRSTLSRHLKKVESLNFEFPSLSLPLDSSRYAISRRSHQRTPSNESFSSAQTTSGFDHSGSNSAGSSYASHDATPLDVAGLEQDRTGEERAQMAGMANASSAVEIAECPACSESLLMRFGGEKTVTPRCGHRLHQECFIAVYGSITRGKTLGVCGICRDNIIISDDGPSGGRNKFASLSGVPRADTIDSHKMRSVSHRTLELFDDPTAVDLTQDDPLYIPTTLLSSVPLDRNGGSSSSSISSQGRRTSSATARQFIAREGGVPDWNVRPIIKVQSEYSTVARSVEKGKKHHLTCMVTIEMPSRWSSPVVSRLSSPVIPQDPKRPRPLTAESRNSGFYPRPSSPTGSTFSAYTYGSNPAHDSAPPPLPSNPFASVVEDLHRRMQDWKGHSPEFGALRIFDRLSIRKGDREHEFLIYLFEEAILCVTDDRAKGAPRGADEKTLRLKGRVYVRHIKEVLNTSGGYGDYSITIKMNDEGLDSFVIVFKDPNSLNVWKSQIELLVERNQHGSPTAPPPAPSSGMGRSHTMSSSRSGESILSDGSDASSRKSMQSAHFSNYTRTTSSSAPPFSPTIREEASIELRRFNSVSPRALSGFFPSKSTVTPPLSSISREFIPLDLMLILSIGPTTLQLNILRNTLDFLINNVGARTRISLVTYCAGDDGEGDLRRTPFIAVGTTEGKARLEGIVSRLGERVSGEGGMIVHQEQNVNVVSAVNLALDVILQRKAKSSLTGIVLMNDGKDGAHKQQMDLVMMRAEVAKVPMHAIGYGLNHEPASLWLLSNHTGGSYTFVREYYELRDVVAGIVGGMLSIAATTVKLHISVPEHRWFRIRKVSGINGAVVSSEGLDVDLSIGDLRLGERKELLVEMEMTMNEPLASKRVAPAFESATDEYFLQKVGMNPMTLGEIDANFYEQEYEGMSTEVPLFEVNLAYQDPATNMSISRLNPSPTLLTVNVVPPANSPTQLASDPAIIRRRMELLTSDMLTRTLTLMSRNNVQQARRMLTETQRIISTISSLVANPSAKPSQRTSLSTAQSLAHAVLASCAEDVAMSIVEPAQPAVASYPVEGAAAEIAAARALFDAELASGEGYEDQGEREGVQLYRKNDPLDAYAVPLVKGECVVENITSDQFLAVIQLPGMRKRWDSRFETGFILERFSRTDYSFFSEMKGMGWLVYPRDIAGHQHNFISTSGTKNEEIVVIQTSVTNELAPEQSGKTRATLTVSGWQLLPQGNDLKVTYIVKIALNGSMPSALVSMIATETPLCTGRARDAFYDLGYPPYVDPAINTATKTVTFQTEHFSEVPAAPEKGALEYRCAFTTVAGATFDILYDTKKMYADGINAVVEGAGAEVTDDGNGTVTVTCTSDGDAAVVVIGPK